jgi:hypothetical protein
MEVVVAMKATSTTGSEGRAEPVTPETAVTAQKKEPFSSPSSLRGSGRNASQFLILIRLLVWLGATTARNGMSMRWW